MKTFKMCITVLCAVCFFLCIFSVSAGAEDTEETNENESIFAELYNTVEPQIQEELEAFGVNGAACKDVLQLSPRAVLREFIKLFNGKIAEPLRVLGLLCGCMLLMAVLDAFVTSSDAVQNIFSMFSALLSCIFLLKPILSALTAAFSSMQVSSGFLLSYIPIFTALLSMQGKMLASAVYSSFMLGLSGLFSVCNTKVFLPLTESILLFHIASALQDKYALSGIGHFIKKAVTLLLTIGSTLFSALLTLKGNLALAGDSMAIRGVKLVVGTAIPVVGSTLSDACSSLLGSFALMKSTMGAFAVLVIAVIHLPAMTELLLWTLTLNFASALAEALGQDRIKKLLSGIASTVSLVNILLVFTSFLCIISTGILLQVKG